MITQIVVPNPAAGTDWRLTIPGQYTAQLISATATLSTLAHPADAVDSSGNGNDLAYNSTRTDLTFGVTGPFGAGGGFAVRTGTNQSLPQIATGTNTGQYDVATVSFEALVRTNGAVGGGLQEIITQRESNSISLLLRWIFGLTTSGTSTLRIAASNVDVFNIGPSFSAGAWHHAAATYDGAQWVPYIDGVAGAAVAGHAPTFTENLLLLTLGGETYSVQAYCGDLAACAIFNGALSGAAVAAHAAAVATSSAAYKAAVLADSPIALWMLDDVDTHGSRLAALEITDGTNVLADYPASFAATTGSTYVWAWVVNAPGAAETVTGGNNIVPIPPITLPAGYTIGTRTPNLASTDQWSGISVWFDDGTIGPAGSIGPTDYLNRMIVPDYGHR